MAELKESPGSQEFTSKKEFSPRKEGEKPQGYYSRVFFEFLKSDVEESKDKEDLLKRLEETSKIAGEITGNKEENSLTDSLTGLYNREGFFRNVDELKRFNENVVLACLDVDGLKLLNDTFGHEAGDMLLVLFANAIKNEKRPYDVAARFGGDEFDIWIFGSELKGAEKLMKRIQERFDESIKSSFEDLEFVDKAGFTFALGKWEGENIRDFVNKIDKELMEKKAGRKKNG